MIVVMKSVMKVDLLCNVCNEETPHTIIYNDNVIEQIVCDCCQYGIMLDDETIKQNTGSDLLKRVVTKPARMTEEMKKDLGLFLKSMPVRIISKPYRMMAEYKKNHEE